ncbi:MAG: hypothetical protein QOE59_1325, partial [Actinomycetota bacterium]|nr:hypothetical protein [Actinomycetota bacterium]
RLDLAALYLGLATGVTGAGVGGGAVGGSDPAARPGVGAG